VSGAGWPTPADFAPPPTEADDRRWEEADRAARPARLDRLRDRFAAAGVDAYFGVRREHTRYLTGFVLADGEEKVAGNSGQFLIGTEEVVLLADSRYTIQARAEAPDARLEAVYHDLPKRWPTLLGSIGARRVGVEAGFVPYALWQRLAAAAPDVELVPIEGWVEADRAVKEPAEIERIAAACAVADRALTTLLPEIRPGVTEAELALRLEWLIRTGGAEAIAFDVACLSGPQAALPHGSPADRPVLEGAVLLFDFGAQVGGYRSDMTRTLFVGEPRPRDLDVYEVVARAQAAAITALEDAGGGAGNAAVGGSGSAPTGRTLDAFAREIVDADGLPPFEHGLGHGIGLSTHELPTLGRRAPDTPLPSPTVFSVEPGVYLEGETGVRIEDLVVFDPAASRVERLTRFPREVVIVGR
jgi:Xaa-Pro aminopeptidase